MAETGFSEGLYIRPTQVKAAQRKSQEMKRTEMVTLKSCSQLYEGLQGIFCWA